MRRRRPVGRPDALSLFNERLAEVFKQAPAFMCVLREPSHIFEMVNDRYLQLIGNREVIGKPVAEALPEVVEQGFVAMLDQVHSTGEPYVGTGRSNRASADADRAAGRTLHRFRVPAAPRSR
jgi:PAS domain-containing protein